MHMNAHTLTFEHSRGSYPFQLFSPMDSFKRFAYLCPLTAESNEPLGPQTCQEKRYMEMPRDWEEKINREKINAGFLKPRA